MNIRTFYANFFTAENNEWEYFAINLSWFDILLKFGHNGKTCSRQISFVVQQYLSLLYTKAELSFSSAEFEQYEMAL